MEKVKMVGMNIFDISFPVTSGFYINLFLTGT
jgi:hypothetical protein